MSNDTTVHVALSSSDRLMTLAAVAYLRNKDRGWRDVNVEEVKPSIEGGYHGARLYGWANENSWNYHITGESGELADLAAKFPELGMDGYYRDEYNYGSLYAGCKSYEYSHDHDGGGRSLEVAVGSLRHLGADMSDAMDVLCSLIDKSSSFFDEGWSYSTPDDPNYAPSLEFSLNDEARGLEDEELCQHFQTYFRSLGAPKDFTLKINQYYGDTSCELPVWADRQVHFNKVAKSEVDEFMVKLDAILAREPEDLLVKLGELEPADLEITDSNENNVLHYAAELGLLDQLPSELLTLEHLTKENYHGQTPIALAIDSGNVEQLPEPYCDENFFRNRERQKFFDQLIENGQDDLALEIARNFPTPLMQEKLDRVEKLESLTRMILKGEGARALDVLRDSEDTLYEDLLEEFHLYENGFPHLSGDIENDEQVTSVTSFFYDFLDLCAERIPQDLSYFCDAVHDLSLSHDITHEDLLNLQRFSHLYYLDISGCEELNDFSFLEWFPLLTTLGMSELPHLTDLTPIGNLTDLTELNLGGCPLLEDLAPLGKLRNLSQLNLGYCASFNDLSPLKELSSLTMLNLRGCKLLRDLSPLAELTNLQDLNLWGCSSLQDLSPLKDLTALYTLDLSHCPAVKDLSPLRGLVQMQWLSLAGLTQLESLDALGDLADLVLLDLESCSSLSDVTALSNLPNLTSVDFRSCTSLSDLSPLAGKEHLNSLVLSDCSSLTDFKFLASLSALSHLELGNLANLQDLSPLSSLSHLANLTLSECPLLVDLSPLLSLDHLIGIDLSSCSPEFPLDDLRQFTGLRTLSLNNLDSLQSIEFLAEMKNLECLSLTGCSSLADLTGLDKMKELYWLDLRGCVALQNLDGIQHLKECEVILPEHLMED